MCVCVGGGGGGACCTGLHRERCKGIDCTTDAGTDAVKDQ